MLDLTIVPSKDSPADIQSFEDPMKYSPPIYHQPENMSYYKKKPLIEAPCKSTALPGRNNEKFQSSFLMSDSESESDYYSDSEDTTGTSISAVSRGRSRVRASSICSGRKIRLKHCGTFLRDESPSVLQREAYTEDKLETDRQRAGHFPLRITGNCNSSTKVLFSGNSAKMLPGRRVSQFTNIDSEDDSYDNTAGTVNGQKTRESPRGSNMQLATCKKVCPTERKPKLVFISSPSSSSLRSLSVES